MNEEQRPELDEHQKEEFRQVLAHKFYGVLKALEYPKQEVAYDFMAEPLRLRPGLEETPDRVAKAWQFWTRGYSANVAEILKTFEDGAAGVDEMVVVKNIPVYSHCEHHMAAIFGTATVAYIPNGRIVGLSKISRVVDVFARRLQVQERLTGQVADAIWEHLRSLGVGVHIKARHMCMESRGICQQGHHTETTALRGVFKEDPAARAEFIGACAS